MDILAVKTFKNSEENRKQGNSFHPKVLFIQLRLKV
jgi:hypothetical protein